MNQINGTITSGKKQLILSDTVCFNPLDGLKIIVPTSDRPTIGFDNHLIFNLLFLDFGHLSGQRELINQ